MSSWTALTPHPPVATTTVHIKKKAGGGGNDADLSSEERAKREADAAARVAGIEALFRDQAQKLEETKAAAELANKKAEMADLEGELLKQKLDTRRSHQFWLHCVNAGIIADPPEAK